MSKVVVERTRWLKYKNFTGQKSASARPWALRTAPPCFKLNNYCSVMSFITHIRPLGTWLLIQCHAYQRMFALDIAGHPPQCLSGVWLVDSGDDLCGHVLFTCCSQTFSRKCKGASTQILIIQCQWVCCDGYVFSKLETSPTHTQTHTPWLPASNSSHTSLKSKSWCVKTKTILSPVPKLGQSVFFKQMSGEERWLSDVISSSDAAAAVLGFTRRCTWEDKLVSQQREGRWGGLMPGKLGCLWKRFLNWLCGKIRKKKAGKLLILDLCPPHSPTAAAGLRADLH